MLRPLFLVALVLCIAAPAFGQRAWIGGGVQYDVQRFVEDVVPNRLDGSTIGWHVGANVRVRPHLMVAAEWCDAGTIEDVQTLTLDINGRTATIMSTFTHQTRSFSALAGYGHELTPRVNLAYLIGVAFTEARRTFSSEAAAAVLVLPSTPGVAMAIEDRFPALTGGVHMHVRLARPMYLVAGIKAVRIRLDPDLRGWSLKPFIGAAWAF